MKTFSLFLPTSLIWSGTLLLAAALEPITNGDFETQSGFGEVPNVDSWFESSGSGYADWVNVAPNAPAQYPGGQANILMMSDPSGYIYQNLGTRADTDLGLQVSGKAVARYPGASRVFRPFRVSIYESDMGIGGLDGNHPSSFSGAVLLDYKDFSSTELGFSAFPTGPELASFTVNLSLGNAITGKRLWLVFDAGDAGNETGLDDLSATSLGTDPGPATRQPLSGSTPRVMLVGDSFWQADVMRQQIYDGLTATGTPFDFVGSRTSSVTDPDNEGLASKQFIHVLNGRDSPPSRASTPIADLLTTYEPDVVALQIGTNDIWYNFQDTTGTDFHENVERSPDQLIDDMRQVANAIHNADPSTRIIVTTVNPISVPNDIIGEQANEFNALAVEYNVKLRAVIPEMQRLGIHISLSDGYEAWGGNTTGNISSDGVHPSTAGYQLLANSWVNAILPALKAFDGSVHYDTTQFIYAQDSAATKVEKAAKLLPRPKQVDWQRLETTYFIHFGLNTFNGVEWGTGYETPSGFVPTDLDATQWVDVVKRAGGKMVMLVVKHHEGFCLYPSRYTTHDVASSPWLGGSGDVVRAVADACAAEGIAFGIYLSPADLYQIESATNYLTGAGYYGHGSVSVPSVIPTDPATFGSNPMQGRPAPASFATYQYMADDYNRYFLNQLYELLTEYGPIAEVWFDGATPKPGLQPQAYNRGDWYDLINKLQPDANIAVKGPDVRWVGNESGYSRNTEWSVIPIPESPTTYQWNDQTATDLGSRSKLLAGSYLHWWPAEADVPILDGWFWKASRTPKTAASLIDVFHASVGRNSNLLLNLSPDNRGLIPDNQITPLLSAMSIIQQTYARSLVNGATATADSTQAEQVAAACMDGDLDTYWEAEAGRSTAQLTLQLPAVTTFDRVVLQEAIAVRGQRIENFSIDAWNGSGWNVIGSSTVVGHKRIVKVPETSTDRVRIRITKARLEPTLAEVGLHLIVPMLAPPSISDRMADGSVAITANAGLVIHYTLDGSEPTTASPAYQAPFPLPLGGTVRALSRAGTTTSLPTTRVFAGVAPIGWQVVNLASEEAPSDTAALAIDDDPDTIWHTGSTAGSTPTPPHHIIIDMGEVRWIRGFTYLPPNDTLIGTVKNYRFATSMDSMTWTEAAAGEFANIRNNPVQQFVLFVSDLQARYFRFSALNDVEGSQHAAAAEISVLPGGFDSFRKDFGLQSADEDENIDGDRIALLLEYYFGLDPWANDSTPIMTRLEGGEIVMDVTRRTALPDTIAVLQSSQDLVSWSDAALLDIETMDLGNEISRDRYRLAIEDGAQFLRLQVTR